MKKLRAYLTKNGLKPTPWAVANGVSRSVVSRLLNGKGISPANAKKIAAATGGDVTELDLLYPPQDKAA